MNRSRQKSGAKSPLRHLVFLGNLEEHAVRESCIGAAEYAAGRSDLDFEPWPLQPEGVAPSLRELGKSDGLLATVQAHRQVFGPRHRPAFPSVLILNNDLQAPAPAVGVDEGMIGRMAAEHLIGRGYPNFAIVFPAHLTWAAGRVQGFAETCRKARRSCTLHEFPQETLPVFWRGNFSKRHRELHELIRDLPKPCGIFAVNDVIACFLIETARFHGFRVPQQIGVIGVDDDPVPNAAAGMSISSVQLPLRQIGWQAASLLDRLRGKKAAPRRVVLPPIRVVVRASTDTFMVPNALVRKAQAYIEANRSRSLRVREVVQAARTTAVTLGKHFVRHLHVSPSGYILLRRIEYAKELLRDRKWTVEQISENCGFHSASYFCKVFKRITGHSPGTLRRN